MNRKVFFSYVRKAPFGGRLTSGQVDGLTRILNEWEKRKLTDSRWLANILAQTFHETAGTMQPIREYGSESYLRSKRYYPWVGEGLIQVTWEENHRKFGATKPGQLLTWPIALKALFDGMTKGMFTGKKLADYFNQNKDDPIMARLIVNGYRKGEKLPDKALLIASYHKNFLDAILKSEEAEVPKSVKVDDDKPDEIKATESKTLMGSISGMLTGITSLGFLSNIDNPWSLAAFGVIGVSAAVIAYLIFKGKINVDAFK